MQIKINSSKSINGNAYLTSVTLLTTKATYKSQQKLCVCLQQVIRTFNIMNILRSDIPKLKHYTSLMFIFILINKNNLYSVQCHMCMCQTCYQ